MADQKSPKITPSRKNATTKNPKVSPPNKKITPKKQSATPTKKMKLHEWSVPPSPKSLEIMYRSIREENTNLKNEVKELFRHLSEGCIDQQIGELLLETLPLLKLYDVFLELKPTVANKNQEGSSSLVPVVLLPDSSSDA